jgi:hypothetical protein
MKFHEYANAFPLMDHAAMLRLAGDIKAKGQSDPIVTLDGQILDGRNRYKACLTAGVKPVMVEYTGTDPLGFVVSHNLCRRHLSESQLGMVAGKIADMQLGDNQKEREGGPSGLPKKTIAEAAEMTNVSERTVKRAKRVINSGIPELQDMVTSGDVNVSVAEKVSSLPAAQQRKAVQGGVAGVRAAAKAPASGESVDTPKKESEFVGNSKPIKEAKIPKWVPDDADRLWLLAKCNLDKILKKDIGRKRVLNEIIEYCQKRISDNK